MEKKELINSIAYCGLICKLCFLASKCDGCKIANNVCDRNLADRSCPQKECCISKNIVGCWECEELSTCELGIYSDNNSPKVKAFALYIQKNGTSKFINSVVRNMKRGISVEKDKDYDRLNIESIHRLLDFGEVPLS
ncbi:MAG: DUF3795 domain-containing protein [Sphaerochaetaceae bacterium]